MDACILVAPKRSAPTTSSLPRIEKTKLGNRLKSPGSVGREPQPPPHPAPPFTPTPSPKHRPPPPRSPPIRVPSGARGVRSAAIERQGPRRRLTRPLAGCQAPRSWRGGRSARGLRGARVRLRSASVRGRGRSGPGGGSQGAGPRQQGGGTGESGSDKRRQGCPTPPEASGQAPASLPSGLCRQWR